MISRDMFKVLNAILDADPRSWLSSAEISKELDMTNRQVVSIISRAGAYMEFVERDGTAYRFTGTDEERKDVRRRLILDRYGFSDDLLEKAADLITDNPLKSTAIGSELGCKASEVHALMNVLPVRTRSVERITYYYIPSEDERSQSARCA